MRNVVRLALERAGCSVSEVATGEDAIRPSVAPPDLVILDVGLPACQDSRCWARSGATQPTWSSGSPPANGEEPDRVMGLRLGADDYLAKPFSPASSWPAPRPSSAARTVRHRRPASSSAIWSSTPPAEVTIGGSPVRLTAKEFDLLRFLAQSPRQVFTRAQLLHHVWDSLPGWQTEATVNEHIHRLRRKVEADPAASPARHGPRQWLSLRPLSPRPRSLRWRLVASDRMRARG